MPFALADRVQETTTSTGTGAVTLAGAAANFVTFGSVLSNGDTTFYVIVDNFNNAWEVGVGTYNASTLSRTTVKASSNGGSLVNFASGVKNVFVDLPADEAQALITDGLTTSTAFGGDVSGAYNAIVVADDSHNHIIANVDGLQTALNGKQPTGNYLTTSTAFGGDVSGTYNAIVVADDSHTHAFNNLTSKTAGTGDYLTTGDFGSGENSGGVAMTVNDGYGNANLTFNHRNGTPDNTSVTQSACRIEATTDSNTGSLSFEISNSTIQDTPVALTQVMYMSTLLINAKVNLNAEAGLDVTGNITVTGTVDGVDIGTNAPNWNAAYNDKINSVGWTSSNYTLTLTQQDAGTLTQVIDTWDNVVLGGSGTIGGNTWANGTFHLGSGTSGWAMDANEFYNSGAGIIGTLASTLTLNPSTSTTTSKPILLGSTVTLSGLSAQASEATALMINGSNVVGTRELGSNAFTSTAYYPDSNPDGYNNYVHPVAAGDDINIDTGALTGATVISDLDFNITTNTLGHVTDANGTVATRNLTLANLGYTGATNANNYVHPVAAGDDINIDTGALTGATVISDLDFNITTNTLGHVTDANGTVATRTLTPDNIGATGLQPTARGMGWEGTYGAASAAIAENAITWDNTEKCLAIKSNQGDTALAGAYRAVYAEAGATVRWTVTLKGSAADADGLYLRLYGYSGTVLPDGKTHVSNSSTNGSPFVQEDTTSDTGWYENGAVPSAWTTFERSWTVPATGYYSLVILNWSGFAGTIYVRQPDVSLVKPATAVLADTATTATSATTAATCTGNSATASKVTHSFGRADAATYPVLWGTATSTTQAFSCAAVKIKSSTAEVQADRFLINNGGTFFSDASGRIATTADFYVQASSGNTYLYSTNTYLGNTSGDSIRCRGNTISGNSWSMTGAGALSTVSATLTGALTGRVCTTATFTSANDAGSISIRGDATKPAVMSFHRVGTYAVNFGLDTDNHLKMGGWTATSIKHTWQNNGDYLAVGNITAYSSDKRLKENIVNIPNALDKVMSLNGVTFDWKEEKVKSLGFEPSIMVNEIGVLAQEIEAVIPQATAPAPFDLINVDGKQESKSGEDYLTVQYEKIVPLLIEAIKEQQEQIEELKDMVSKLTQC